MANWKYVLRVDDIWRQGKDRAITASEMGKLLAKRITNCGVADDEGELNDIVEELLHLPQDATFEDFDDVLEMLYDWADYDHRLWIDTLKER